MTPLSEARRFVCILPLEREGRSLQSCLAVTRQGLPELDRQKTGFLHADELAYYRTLPADKRKLSYLLGRWAAKHSLSGLIAEPDLTAINIENGILCHPVVHSAKIHNCQVSYSHSEDRCASIAFPEIHPMAVDIEMITPDNKLHSIMHCSELEKANLSKAPLDDTSRLTILWTIKESISKVLKTGLMTDFRLFEVNKTEVFENFLVSHFTNFAQYKAYSWCSSGYAVSIVMPKRTNIGARDLVNRVTQAWD